MANTDIPLQVKEHLTKALEYFSESNYKDAVYELKAAEVLDPKNPEILYNLGIIHAKMSLHHTAEEFLKKLISDSPGFIEITQVHNALAFSLSQQDKSDEALEYLNETLRLEPKNIASKSMIAYILEKQGSISEAIKAYRNILEIDPDNMTAMNSLAYCLACREENLEEAEKLAQLALKQKPNNPAYLDTLGFIFIKKGNYKEAKKCLKKAKKIYPLPSEIDEHLTLLKTREKDKK